MDVLGPHRRFQVALSTVQNLKEQRANNAGSDGFEAAQATPVGSVDFYNLVIDDRQSGVEIWQVDDGSLVVTRQLDGKVLGVFTDLAAIRSKIRFSDTTYRKLFLPAGSKQGQEEAW